ncbi:hypothetical protein HDV01_004071 [Terramyces sp. JEL0728]|nr:hypothetical protein HDV01_004071 [Terramyces sp. JEL0728]
MSNKVEMEIDPDDVLTGADEAERQKQIQMFVMTAKELYREDGISFLTDTEIAKWLLGYAGHRGKGLAALSETLQWRKDFNVNSILSEEFISMEKTGRLQYFGNALDGSCIIVWNGSKYVGPKTESEREKEMRFIVYFIELGRKRGYIRVKLEALPRETVQNDSPAALYEWIARESYFKKYGGLADDPFENTARDNPLEKDLASVPKVLKSNIAADLKVVEELWSAPTEYQDI